MEILTQVARPRAEKPSKYRYSTPLPFVDLLVHGEAQPVLGTKREPSASSSSDESREHGLLSESDFSPQLSHTATSATSYTDSPIRSIEDQNDADSNQCQTSSSSGSDSTEASSNGTNCDLESEPSPNSFAIAATCISSDSSVDVGRAVDSTPSQTSSEPTNQSDSSRSSAETARSAVMTKSTVHALTDSQAAQSHPPSHRRRVSFDPSVQDMTQTQHHRQLARNRKTSFERPECARSETRGQSERLKTYDGPRRYFQRNTSENQHQAQKHIQPSVRDGVPHIMTRESDVLVETVEGVSLTTEHDSKSNHGGSMPIPEIEARDVQGIESLSEDSRHRLDVDFEHYNRQYSQSLPPASHASQTERTGSRSTPIRPNKKASGNSLWTKKGWKERTKQLLAGPLYQPDDAASADIYPDPATDTQQPKKEGRRYWTASHGGRGPEDVSARPLSSSSMESAAPAPSVPLRRA